MLFHEKQQDALRTIKRYRHVSREQLEEIAEQPQTIFDPEVVELDPTDEIPSFSERVREIGIYRPRVYPFVSPYKSDWIPGMLVENASGERTKFRVKNEAKFTKLKQRMDQAKRTGQKHLTWNGHQLPIRDLEDHLSFIEKQLKHRNKPSRSQRDKSLAAVLIIEENIEASEYVEEKKEKSDSSVSEPFRHLFESPPNLKSGVALLPHQEEGVAWTQQLWEKGYSGGLLADDMGVSKTLQVLCFLE